MIKKLDNGDVVKLKYRQFNNEQDVSNFLMFNPHYVKVSLEQIGVLCFGFQMALRFYDSTAEPLKKDVDYYEDTEENLIRIIDEEVKQNGGRFMKGEFSSETQFKERKTGQYGPFMFYYIIDKDPRDKLYGFDVLMIETIIIPDALQTT